MFDSGNPESYSDPVGYMEQCIQMPGDPPLIDIDKLVESCGDLPLVNLNDISGCPSATDIEQLLQSYGGSQFVNMEEILQSWNDIPFVNLNDISSCPSATDIEQVSQSYGGSQLVNMEEIFKSWNNLPFVNPENVVEHCNYAQFSDGGQLLDTSGSSMVGHNENPLIATDEECTTASGLFTTHLDTLDQIPLQEYYFDMGLEGVVGLEEETCEACKVSAKFQAGVDGWEQTNSNLPQTQCSSSFSMAPYGGISTGLQCFIAPPQLDAVLDYVNNNPQPGLISGNETHEGHHTIEDAFIRGTGRQQTGQIMLKNTEVEEWNVNRRKMPEAVATTEGGECRSGEYGIGL